MKTLHFILLTFFASIGINYAQVGIGTETPNVMLDISSSNQATPSNTDGVLIPKIDAFPTKDPTALQDGMLVYVTGNGTATKGFYYWDETVTDWVTVDNTSGWSETGNTGTDATTNFIGTTDAQDLSFRVQNLERMRLTNQGQLEFLNSGFSVFIGEDAGNNDRVMLRQDGTDHIFIGDIDNNGGNFKVRTGGVNAMTVLSGNRNVGIGLNNPTRQLQLSTNSAGKPTSAVWDVTSDRRLKKDVTPFNDGLATLEEINPVWFTYNGLAEMPMETGVGTIAQELQEVAPYLVKDWEYIDEEGAKETYLSVDYGPLTFIMVNAIKEQAQEITQLKSQLLVQQEQYREQLHQMQERLTRLEN